VSISRFTGDALDGARNDHCLARIDLDVGTASRMTEGRHLRVYRENFDEVLRTDCSDLGTLRV